MTKNLFVKNFVFALAVAVLFAACEGEEGSEGPQGEAGADGAASLISITAESAGDNCANGGFRVDVGTDTSGDGTLDNDEVSSTAYACDGGSGSDGNDGNDGNDGSDFLVISTPEGPGSNCPFGGYKIDSGLDTDESGTLEESEITDTFYVCNGVSGGSSAKIGDYNWSNLDALVSTFPGFNNVRVSSLVSSTDILNTFDGANDFQLGGSADGAGMVVDADGDLALLANCEDHYSVVRIKLDPTTLEPKQGDYMLNSSVNEYARQCSGTMWEAAIHGGSEDFFISASENFNLYCKRIDIDETPDVDNNSDQLTALGLFNWENAVPLPDGAYSGSTVIIGGDDDSSDSEGQLVLYYSTAGDADLAGGKVYVLRRVGATAVETEENLDFGVSIDVEFVELENANGGLTYAETEQISVDSLSLQFMRIEDVDYVKGEDTDARTVFFAVTGRGPGRGTYNDWGTGYKLVLDDANPLTGTLTQVISGNTDTNKMDGNMPGLQSPDNICVTENFVYWQEDPNSFSRGHQAYIWVTDLNGEGATPVLQINYDYGLDAEDGSFDSDGLNGEFGAMVDISDKVGEDGTFILCLQPHYWENEIYEGIDGDVRTVFTGGDQDGGREDDQGSQIVVLQGLPR